MFISLVVCVLLLPCTSVANVATAWQAVIGLLLLPYTSVANVATAWQAVIGLLLLPYTSVANVATAWQAVIGVPLFACTSVATIATVATAWQARYRGPVHFYDPGHYRIKRKVFNIFSCVRERLCASVCTVYTPRPVRACLCLCNTNVIFSSTFPITTSFPNPAPPLTPILVLKFFH